MAKENIFLEQECQLSQHVVSCSDDKRKREIQQIPNIGEIIRSGRVRKKLSKSELAKLTGLNPAEITRIESEKIKKPSLKVLKALSPYAGIPYHKLTLFAGYSGIVEEELYYDTSGNVIPHCEILDSIYYADPELLELLANVDKIDYDGICTLKNMLIILNQSTSQEAPEALMTTFQKMFEDTKSFIFQQLENMAGILLRSDRA